MKIEQLLLQPHGQKLNAGILTIKTCKKTWQVGEIWWHQVLFMDETGEMPADVKIGTYSPLKRGTDVKVIVAEVRDAEYLGKPRKILVVDQYKVETQMVDDYYAEADKAYETEMKEVRGKVRHGVTCSFIQAGNLVNRDSLPASPNSDPYMKKIINEWTEFIMTGE